MKNKNLLILFISLTGFLIIGLTIFLIFLLGDTQNTFNLFTYKKEFKENILFEEKYNLSEIMDIKVDNSSVDVEFKTTNDSVIKVEIHGEKKDNIEVKQENDTLSIFYKSKFNYCIGFCNIYEKVIIYLPSSYDKKINIKSGSGDIEKLYAPKASAEIYTKSGEVNIKSLYKAEIKTSSGDVEVGEVHYLNIETSSGELELGKIKEMITIETSSGDVQIDLLTLTSDGFIKTSSGEVNIRRIADIYIDSKTRSGDIDIKNNNRTATFELKIETSSGDIEVNE